MTEAEWLVCNDSVKQLHVIQNTGASERKIRLFNAAICRRFWDYLPEASRAILAESELLAEESSAPRGRGKELCSRANDVVAPFDRQYPDKRFPSREARIQRGAAVAVCYAVLAGDLFGALGYLLEIEPKEEGPQSAIIRDVFGNPFRPRPSIDPASTAWKDGIVKLAQAVYDNRLLPQGTFDPLRLEILADALEEVGCGDAELLSHLRAVGPHVRGCDALDVILGR